MIRHIQVAWLLLVCVSSTAHADGGRWLATWGAAMQAPVFTEAQVLEQQTVRQIVHLSRGGETLRVTFSNATGSKPLVLDAASVALRAVNERITQGTQRPLLFGGERAITIPPGAVAVTDEVSLHAPDQADLAISLYVKAATPATTQLSNAHQTSFVSGPGDFTESESFAPAGMIASWYWLSGVEVRVPHANRALTVVAFGDSITEGYQSTVDTNSRWPDVLARRLAEQRGDTAVINMGIGGNRVLNDEVGPNAQRRLDRDLLTQSGADVAIFLEGINDIGAPSTLQTLPGVPPDVDVSEVDAASIIAGYEQIIRRAHAAGITIHGGTLTAIGGSSYDSASNEAKRQAVNAWIRNGRGFDGVIDFDAALRDPVHPAQLLPAYDSGDHLHPNDAGYAKMGATVDLRLLRAHR